MKIGIIGAIKKEIQILQKIIINCVEKKIGNCQIYIGSFKNINIFLIRSGIGKVAASISTTILINLYKPNIIINSGSAGSLNSLLKIGDIIIPNKICYYDVDLVNFGYALGQIPECPKEFLIQKKFFNFIKNISIDFKFQFTTGLLITGDSFVRESELIKKLKHQFSSAIAVEMESAAIAQVCHQFNVPLIVIKSISDLSDKNATLNFKKNISIASFQSSKIVQLILENMINI